METTSTPSESKKKIVTSVFWKFFERFGAQLVSFAVTIVLARLLLPEDYGNVAIITIFVNILDVFISSGFPTALIQKKNSDELDFFSVLYFNMAFSVLLYVILYFTAPYFCGYFANDTLTDPLRIMGLGLLVGSINSVEQSYIAKTMQFRLFFFGTLIGTVMSAAVGIAMAYHGFGVWALVAQELTNRCTDTLVLFLLIRKKPRMIFSWPRLKIMISFSWKILLSGLIDTVYNNCRSLIIGKKYSEAELAYYKKGDEFPTLLVSNINESIQSVLFPVLSNVQEDKIRLKKIVKLSISVSSFVVVPMVLGVACVAGPMVDLFLTSKWAECVPYVQILCLAYALWPIHTANLQAIKALGDSRTFLILEIIKKVIGISLLIGAMFLGPLYIAGAFALSSILGVFINSFPNKKMLDYGFFEQVKDVFPYLAMAGLMYLPIYFLNRLSWPSWALLLIDVVVGIAVYGGLTLLFKPFAYRYLLSAYQTRRLKKKAMAAQGEQPK
jgi:O-antigen/teichoic acid export membrane protein